MPLARFGLSITAVVVVVLAAVKFAGATASEQPSRPDVADATVVGSRASVVREPTVPQRADSMFGVFEGRTPCGAISSGFTGFGGPGCEKIKWRLTLLREPASGAPSMYRYAGTRTNRSGRWMMEQVGAGRRIIRLHDDRQQLALSLLSIDDRVLLLLDINDEVLVGDASWSYALNRVNPGPP